MTEAVNEEKTDPKRNTSWAFNPFQKVSGVKALVVGLVLILAAGFIGSLSTLHFNGVLDFNTGMEVPLWFTLCEGLVAWLVMGVMLFFAGMIVAKGRVSFLDVFGNQALARFPTLVIALMALIPGYKIVGEKLTAIMLDPTKLNMESLAGLGAFGVLAIIALLMVLWMIVLMYRAFAVSCKIKGGRAIAAFMAVIVVGEVVSKIVWLAVAAPVVDANQITKAIPRSTRPQSEARQGEGEGRGGPRTQFSPEEAKKVWTMQATSVPANLALSDELSGKLLQAYVAARESHQKGREELFSSPERRGYEGFRELTDKERAKLDTALKEVLNEEQAATAIASLGSFSRTNDRYANTIAGFGLEEKVVASTMDLINTYTVEYAKARSEAREMDNEELGRTARQQLRENLDEQMAKLLSEEQLATWKEASASRRGPR